MVTRQCAKYLHIGSLSTSDVGESRKRRKMQTKRFGYDEDDTESESDGDESTTCDKRRPLTMKRQDAISMPTLNNATPTENFPSSFLCGPQSTSSPVQTQEASFISETDYQSKIVHENMTESVCSCHCEHVAHWSKQIILLLIRMEQKLNRKNTKTEDESEEQDGVEATYCASSTDELSSLLEDKEQRTNALNQAKKEVTRNKKESITNILIRLAPPSVWKSYSKNGQRGKLSALKLGVHTFVFDAMNNSQVRVLEICNSFFSSH